MLLQGHKGYALLLHDLGDLVGLCDSQCSDIQGPSLEGGLIWEGCGMSFGQVVLGRLVQRG